MVFSKGCGSALLYLDESRNENNSAAGVTGTRNRAQVSLSLRRPFRNIQQLRPQQKAGGQFPRVARKVPPHSVGEGEAYCCIRRQEVKRSVPGAAIIMEIEKFPGVHYETADLVPRSAARALVSLIEGWTTTYEDSAKTTERERETHFGQYDQVRYYGADFRARVRAAGSTLEEFAAGGAEAWQFLLRRGERFSSP